jgi:hypothetical protein
MSITLITLLRYDTKDSIESLAPVDTFDTARDI